MKAVLFERYGPPDVVRVVDLEEPLPKADELLIRVRASTVSQTDTHMRRPDPVFWRLLLGLRRPRARWRVLGVEFAGEVVGVGAAVSAFKVGDEVFGQPAGYVGAHQEYLCIRETAVIAHKPAAMTFEEAAAVCEGATEAFAAIRAAGVESGQQIVIYGASGSLGTAAVQLAKHLGAHVTAVCGTAHVELVRTLGPDEVVDYRAEDFTKRGATYDAIIDAVGKYSYGRGRHALKSDGVYVATDGRGIFLWSWLTRLFRMKRFRTAAGRRNRADLLSLKDLIDAGEFRAVIDRRYPMAEAAEAHRYVEAWHKAGNVVLTIP